MEHCKTLYEYSLFVQCIREKLKSENIDEAVKNAVEYCIDNNILADFLRKNKAEVIPMPIFECNMAEVLEKIARDRYEEGYRVGLEESLKEQNLSLSEEEINYLVEKASSKLKLDDYLKEPLDRINKLYEQLYD